jgi:hypothetical protein
MDEQRVEYKERNRGSGEHRAHKRQNMYVGALTLVRFHEAANKQDNDRLSLSAVVDTISVEHSCPLSP